MKINAMLYLFIKSDHVATHTVDCSTLVLLLIHEPTKILTLLAHADRSRNYILCKQNAYFFK